MTETLQGLIIRGMTPQDGFRLVALDSTAAVQQAIDAQNARGDSARLFGELLTGTTLIRETMAPALRVQAVVKHAQAGSIVADSHPDGLTRGLVHLRDDDAFELGSSALLQVMRALPNGELHQGVVSTEAHRGLAASLTTYMHTSEQVDSAIGVACVLEDARVVAAGGYMLQKMPDAQFLDLARITAHLEHFESLERALVDSRANPEALLATLLHDVDYDILARSSMRFGCNCSQARFLHSLSAIGRDELTQLVAEAKALDIECDYCARGYEISIPMLEQLLDTGA